MALFRSNFLPQKYFSILLGFMSQLLYVLCTGAMWYKQLRYDYVQLRYDIIKTLQLLQRKLHKTRQISFKKMLYQLYPFGLGVVKIMT